MSGKPRAADDFPTIRARMEELGRERAAVTSSKEDDWLRVGVAVKIMRKADGGVISHSHTIEHSTIGSIKAELARGRWVVKEVIDETLVVAPGTR